LESGPSGEVREYANRAAIVRLSERAMICRFQCGVPYERQIVMKRIEPTGVLFFYSLSEEPLNARSLVKPNLIQIQYRSQPCQCAHPFIRIVVWKASIGGLQNVASLRGFGDHPQQILIVAAGILALDLQDAAGDRPGTGLVDEFEKQIVAVVDWLFATVHRVADSAGDEMAGWVQPTVAGTDTAENRK